MNDAVLIVLQHDDRILLVRRAANVPRPGVWSPPSGRVEPGETHAAAVEREALEELGLHVRARDEVWQSDTDDGAWRLHWWRADVVGGVLTPDPAEVADVRWVTAAEFLALQPTFAGHRAFFTDVLPTLRRA